jgi:hypothetical protein
MAVDMSLNNAEQIELYNQLCLQPNSADPHATFFTGWKEIPADADWETRSGATYLGSGYAVGQILHFFKGKMNGCDHGVYVNLPGMESGHCFAGQIIDIGEERIKVSTPPSVDEMREMLTVGLKKLTALIEEWKDKES